MTSFRTRIQYETLGLILILLIILDVVLYVGIHKAFQAYVDARLEAMADTWADIMSENAGMMLPTLQQTDHEATGKSPTDGAPPDRALSVRVLSVDGRTLWRSPAGQSDDISVPESVREGQRVFQTVERNGRSSVRIIWIPIRYQGEMLYIEVQTVTRLMENALSDLILLLAAGSLAITGLAWFGCRWLARQTLLPIEALTTTAQNIAVTSSLSPRLQLDAPYVEFHRLAQVFNAMMDRLERAFDGQRRFVTDAAHELHTPLTALKGNLEVAFARKRNAAEYRETLIGNLGAVDRLIQVCRSLITLAKLSGQGSQPPRQHLAVEPLLREVIDELRVLGDDRRVDICMEAHPVPPMYGNKEQLQRVIVNLLDNALRHTGPGGTVTATLSASRTRIVLSITDTGEGIASEHLPHIFDRFYRADQSRSRDSGGVGLGLSIVKEIVMAHRGNIAVVSEANKGTTFTITLPVHTDLEERDRSDASGQLRRGSANH